MSGVVLWGWEKSNEKQPIVKRLSPNSIVAARLGGMGVALSANVAEEVVSLI